MENKKLDRINVLAKKSREEGLTDEEKLEQKKLREEYIAEYRRGLEMQLENMYVLDKDGTEPMDVQLHFLDPIPYEEYKSLKTPELAALVKERIQKVIDENT